MATTIKLKNGSGTPLASDLVQGEPAFDLTNKRLFTEDSVGTVIEVGTNPSSLSIDGVAVTATPAELNILDGVTATTAELNILDGVTATTTEINYLDGVTSSIQAQLDSKGSASDLSDFGLTATAAEINVLDGIIATTTELNYVDGVTSAIQTQLDAKGTVSTLSDLSVTATAAELNLLDGVTATTTELNYVDGVTSSIQSQLDNKVSSASPTFTGTVTAQEMLLSSVSPVLTIKDNNSTTPTNTYIQFKDSLDNDEGSIGHSDASGDFRIINRFNDIVFLTGSTPTERMRIDSAGNVDISQQVTLGATSNLRLNSSSLTATIDSSSDNFVLRHSTATGIIAMQVNGESNTHAFYGNGNVVIAGTLTESGSPSDLKLKENVQVIPDALAKVQKLDGITWNYKKDGLAMTGLIAQQLEEVLPEVVYETTDIDTNEKQLAVRYGNTVGLLVEAIKELKSELDELKAQLQEK